jgi:peptidoglycan/xylan/chitin deacetylase (PgdA/CDA1 family)
MNRGLMFHHFADALHSHGQGAITAAQFEAIISAVGRERILPAREWLDLALRDALRPDQTCITFDDALRCQFDVALPVLRKFDLTGFWFVYSSVFQGNVEDFEVFRFFRTTEFESISAFYRFFSDTVRQSYPDAFSRAVGAFDPKAYLAEYAFYTDEDRFFRFLRDEALGEGLYRRAMDVAMTQRNFDRRKALELLWMNDSSLRTLHAEGHVVGLHSYSHPTRLAALDPAEQALEYRRNLDHIARVTGEAPVTVAHPSNSYGPATLEILRGLGVRLGFRDNDAPVAGRSRLEYPRRDHVELLRGTAT